MSAGRGRGSGKVGVGRVESWTVWSWDAGGGTAALHYWCDVHVRVSRRQGTFSLLFDVVRLSKREAGIHI